VAETKALAEQVKNLSRISEVMDRLNVAADEGTATGESVEAKEVISSMYDFVAATWSLGDLWNWGLCDPELHHEINQIIDGYDRFGTDGFSEQLYFYTLRQVPLALTEYRGKQVLEVGSGIGAGLNFLSRVVNSAELSGVDLSKVAVERANARYSRPSTVTFTCGDAESLPSDSGTFDVVLNIESSHNYPNLGGFFSEVARVLRPGGYFTTVDFFTDQRKKIFDRAKVACGQLKWLAENDVSAQVGAAVRQRMAPGSYIQEAYARQRMPRLQRIVGKHCWTASFGGHFTGHASQSPIAKWSRKVGGLSTMDKAPVRAYIHHLATRLP
jgi:ubiquinone/menaquinone biosynthesis C-methylase UbiE